MKNAYRKIQLLILFSIITFSVNAANRYWIASSTANWNSTTNWSTTSGGAGGASVPGSSDRAIFDGNGLGRCNINANASVLHFDVRNGYTDSIVQQNSYTVTVASNGSFAVSGGIFIGGNSNITISGTFTLDSNALFTSTSATLAIRDAVTIDDGDDFTHNNGLFSLTSLAAGSVITVDFDTITLYDFKINNTSGAKKITFGSDNEITVNNNLSLNGNTTSNYDITLFSGKIFCKKNIYVAYKKSTIHGQGTTEIVLDGTGTQTIDGTGNVNGALFGITINKSSDTLKIKSAINIQNNWTNNGCIMYHYSSSAVTFKYASTIDGNTEFYKLSFDGDYNRTQWNIIDTVNVNSDLFFIGNGIVYLLGGEIHCKKNFDISNNTAVNDSGSSSTYIGTTKIFFDFNEDQYWIGRSSGSKTWMPVIIIDKSDGTLFLTNNISLGGQLHYIRGDIDYGTSTITFVKNCIITGNDFGLYNVTLLPPILYDAAIDVEDSTILTVNGVLNFANTDYNNQSYFTGGSIHAKGNVVVANDVSIDNNVAEIIINGSGNQTLDGIANYDEGNLPNVIINKSEGTLFLKDYINVSGNWKYIQGTIDFSTYTNYLCMRSTYNPTIIGSHEIKNLIFYRPSSSGSKTFKIRNTSTLTVNGNLSTYGTSLFVLDSGTIDIKGNITVSSGLNGGMGTIKVSGTGNQTFTGIASIINQGEMPNFTINKSSGSFIVTNYMNIMKTLTFTNGIITTANGSSLVYFLTNASSSGASKTSYIDGKVGKYSNQAFTFPVGERGMYRPLTMTAPTSASAQYEVEYFAKNQTLGNTIDTSLAAISQDEYWQFSRVVQTNTVKATMAWSENKFEIPGDSTELTSAYWNGSSWVKLTNDLITGNATNGSLRTPALTNYSYLVLAQTKKNYYFVETKHKLDGGVYLTKNKRLYVKYKGEYNLSQFKFNIYDMNNDIVANENSSGAVNKFYQHNGDNRYTFNFSLSGHSLPAGYYILEIINDKNEKEYLRFQKL